MEKVIVYSKPNCVQCNATYRELDKNNIEYSIVDISVDKEALDKVVALGHKQAPVVTVGDEHWSGFNPSKIKGILNK